MSEIIRRDDDLAKAVRQRDIGAVVRMMFEGNPPSVKSGYRTETELWDFKKDCPEVGPARTDAMWAEISKDVVGFYNNRGGVIIFGVSDTDLRFLGATRRLDSKLFNDQIRRFLGDRIWVEFHREFIKQDQRYLGVALIPPRGSTIERFKIDAPEVNGRRLFEKGDTALREGDSTRVISREEAKTLARGLSVPTVGKVFEIDEPILQDS